MKLFENLSERQKMGLIVILCAAALALAFLPMFIGGETEDPGEEPSENAVADIQDPETDAPEDSKLAAYGSADPGNSRRLWDALEEGYSEDDPYEDDAPRGGTGGRAKETTEEEVYGSLAVGSGKDREREPAPAVTGAPKPGDPGYKEYRMNQYYQSTDATIRSGEAAKDSIRRAAQTETEDNVVDNDEPASVIGTDAPVRRTSAMSTLDADAGSGFSSLGDAGEETVTENGDYPFECMFVRAEKLRSGSRVSVRLLEDMVVGGTLIPKNTHLMAMCSIDDRLQLTVSSVEMNSRIYSLGYEAYDTDGGRGIYCPDLNADARRNVKSRGLSTLSGTLSSRLGRIASDAVQTGVSIAQTKSGEVTVSVPAGYRFFIVRKQK
jgi:hypothetical protein